MKTLLKRGFTVVELLLVIVVIGVLASIVLVAYNGVTQNAKDKTVQSDLDALDAIETQYASKNAGVARTYYSGTSADVTALGFAPSPGNIIDVAVSAAGYCMRGYNLAGSKNSITNSYTKESDSGMCVALTPSSSAGGTGANNLIGWWKLNGGAIDSSGNGYNGVVSGATLTPGANGTSNGAYLFNGTTNYISLTGSNMSLPTTFSVTSWVKLTSTNVGSLWNFIIAGDYGDFGFGVIKYSGNGQPYFMLTKTSTIDSTLSTTAIGDTGWHQIVMTFSSGSLQYYIDSAPAGSSTFSNTFSPTVKRIGSSPAFASTMNGAIDDVRLYSRTLSAGEVSAVYSAGAQ
jgi:prepilin-type N-terminal cleavage/methylation domain-containing protein